MEAARGAALCAQWSWREWVRQLSVREALKSRPWWACTLLVGATGPHALLRAQQPVPAAPATTRTDSVTVTTDRGLANTTDPSATVVLLQGAALTAPPALALDDTLRQVAGFQLFRRTSSWTANPTTQGVSLRGLGSTAASRTLIVSDQVPLLDPFGGWVHWNELPERAIQAVAVQVGGAANLYGSSAIGGVIDVVPVTAASDRRILQADALGATEHTAGGNVLAAGSLGILQALAAGSVLSTQGYVPTAPAFRGSVDARSNVTGESGRLELRTGPAPRTAFLRGNVLNEARGNGTPLQTNGTRLWRYAGGADTVTGRTAETLRLFGSRETYRQTFSSIAADRNNERLTRLQRVPVDEFGGALGASTILGAVTGSLGIDVRDVRATDVESPITNGIATSTTATAARQRATGGFADAVWQPRAWTVSGSVRVDSFRTFDGVTRNSATAAQTPQPEVDELLASPRLGVARQLPHGVLLTANAFRAFRGPTLNELYRTGQVGQQTTLANPSLRAERATGMEFGGEGSGRAGRIRATWFWTEVNRPISAVLLTQTSTAQTLQRQNLGQIRSRGLSLQAHANRWHGLEGDLSYQLAVATVTRYTPPSALQTNLLGRWIPEVPRQSIAATATYTARRVADLHLYSIYSGRQFDDAENQFILHPFLRVDLSAERQLGRGVSLFAGAQNLLNKQIEAGRTPVLTLASPRVVQAGVRLRLGR